MTLLKTVMIGLAVCVLNAPDVFAEHVIYLVRHAEKAAEPKQDPVLTRCGMLRASSLAEFFQDKNLSHIYSSNYVRTRDTAKPVSEVTGINVVLYDPSHLEVTANRLRKLEGNILVVGHSNTTPELAGFIIGDAVAPLSEKIYDRLYVVKKLEGSDYTVAVSAQGFVCEK